MLQSLASKAARQNLADAIILAKTRKGLSWKQIADGTGCSREFVVSALLGQHALSKPVADLVAERLGLDEDQVLLLQAVPSRGSVWEQGFPTDPTVYRFYEIVSVYGSTLKAIIHEDFGDGIISAINFKLNVEKIDDPDGGHRAVITLDGKYLPSKPF